MKTLPLLVGTGLLCAGLAVGCAESGTNSGRTANGPGNTPAEPESTAPAWIEDVGVTRAHVLVTGMD